MKWLVRSMVVVLCLLGAFFRMPVIHVNSGDTTSKTIRYVALGDSIAHGYGLTDPEADSYVGQIRTYLEQTYDYVFLKNFGTDGIRSEELLDILTNPSNENYAAYHATLQHVDLVTVSIGSNDLLHLIRLDRDMKEYVEQGDAMFLTACEQFSVNFPRIVEAIHRIAPDAQIYVNNIYNPAHGLTQFADIYRLAEKYIGLLNDTFEKENGYTLVDIKSAFDASEDKLINMAVSGAKPDPHPNRQGHNKIAEMVIGKMKERGN